MLLIEERRLKMFAEQQVKTKEKQTEQLQSEIERHQLRVESKSSLNPSLGLQKHIDSLGVATITNRTDIALVQENIKLKEQLSQYELQIKDIEEELAQFK